MREIGVRVDHVAKQIVVFEVELLVLENGGQDLHESGVLDGDVDVLGHQVHALLQHVVGYFEHFGVPE